jgi:hypothetical protein
MSGAAPDGTPEDSSSSRATPNSSAVLERSARHENDVSRRSPAPAARAVARIEDQMRSVKRFAMVGG